MTTTLLQTPFHDVHVNHGGKMVDFAGWSMPLHYGSIIDEHHQTRNSGSLFDVSHMGRFRFKGRDARRFLDFVCTRQIFGMSDGQARYSMVCNEDGGVKDDVLVYRLGESEYMMVCNASNRLKLIDHFADVRGDHVFKFTDETESTGMVAVQGPKVMELISNFSSEIPTLKRYRFTVKNLLIAKVMISRTGYTGEDGVEIILPGKFANKAVDMLMKNVGSGDDAAIKPAGLGARDSLRLEAGMALYGHEITEEIDPVSANLGFAIKFNKGDDNPEIGRFIGQDVIDRLHTEGTARRLVGLVLEGRRAARQHMDVVINGTIVGEVTSGCLSPTLGTSIAMAYVDAANADPGTTVEVDLGRQQIPATVTTLPFTA
ncbi:MAG: glycine cleavage system aminomethyltransferase GcvT [Planctomycetota bacterium]